MKKVLSVLSLLLAIGAVLEATTIPTTPVEVVATGANPEFLVYSHSGALAAVANFDDDTISVYKVDADDGTFTQVASSPFPAGQDPLSIAFSPSDRNLAVANTNFSGLSQSSLYIYRVHCKTGRLSLIQAITQAQDPTIVLPSSVAYSPDGRFVAIANNGTSAGTDSTVSVYAVNPIDGKLFLPPVQTFLPGMGTPGTGPFTVAYSPDGRFAAVTLGNLPNFAVANFVVDPVTGEFLNEFDAPSGTFPTGVTYSHNGLFAAITNSDNVTTYTVNQTTGHFSVLQLAVPTGSLPQYIAYSPEDLVAAVSNDGDGTITLYCVDASGNFSNAQTVPINSATGHPVGIDFAPCNDFVAVTDAVKNNVTILKVGVEACQ
jgi:6-phosphogluconolactonase (cycloisomerase 2 family)